MKKGEKKQKIIYRMDSVQLGFFYPFREWAHIYSPSTEWNLTLKISLNFLSK